MKKFLLLSLLSVVWSACSEQGQTISFDYRFTNDIMLLHTPVKSQGRTQTCWAFTMASLLESEYLATHQDTIRLSVMYAVRQKYMRHLEQSYYSKGKDEIRGGSLGHTFLTDLKEMGCMPYEAYKGHLPDAKRHDHRKLVKEMKALVDKAVKQKDLHTLKQKANELFDQYLGKVLSSFDYKGKTYTPQAFAESLNINPSKYVELTSFTHHPFDECFVLEVPDNWEHASYYNVPLDSLEKYVVQSLENGKTVAWDGDTSEEGFMAQQGLALLPDSLVTQENRQQGFERFETTDDHMMHIVGMAHDEQGRRYYILKNSWGRVGPYKGLVYMSQNYFRAKTVSVVLDYPLKR